MPPVRSLPLRGAFGPPPGAGKRREQVGDSWGKGFTMMFFLAEWPELQAWPYELLVAGYVVSTAIGGLIAWGVCGRSDDVSCGCGLKKKGIS